MRTEGYGESISLLNRGIFYGNSYLEHLLDLNGKKLSDDAQDAIKTRLAAFIEQGSFFHGLAPKKYFKLQDNSASATGKTIMQYFLKNKGVSPSTALEAILSKKELMFGDCGSMCQIPYYEGLRKVLGNDKFDFLFAQDGPTPFMIGLAQGLDPLMYLVQDIHYSKKKLANGDWVYIKGPDFYGDKHFNGEGRSWNVLCLNHKKETFIGLGLKPEGASFKDIELGFLKEYNDDPVGIKGMSAEAAEKLLSTYSSSYLQRAKALEGHQITLSELREKGKVDYVLIRKLDMSRVTQLVDATPEKGRELLVIWKKKVQEQKMHRI
jgi:hypothetical protein